MGAGKKKLKKLRMRMRIAYRFILNSPSHTTRCLFNHTPLFFCTKDEFSNCFSFFAKHLRPIYDDIDISSIIEYRSFFMAHKGITINSFEHLKKHINGYLFIKLQQCESTKNYVRITKDGINYNIISGVYILPWAKSILQAEEHLTGFMLDTTWKIMQKYVTSILMGNIYNVGIPIGFSFGKSEDKEIYSSLLKTISDKFQYNFDRKVLLSDQGSALKATAESFKMIHLLCLRHLLVSIKFNIISYPLGIFLRSVSENDMTYAQSFLYANLQNLQNPKMKAYARKLCQKIGIDFDDSGIKIVDEQHLKSVSMHYRTEYRMPSTTNSLEATHGHLNKKTPRRNNFFMSIYRIVSNLMSKSQNIVKEIKTNYRRACFNSTKYAKATSEERMQLEISHYHSSQDCCECSENMLLAAALGFDIPCSHRIKLGAEIPETPEIDLKFTSDVETLQIEYLYLPRDDNADQLSEEAYDKQQAIETITRFSHYHKKDRIIEYVNENYNRPVLNEAFIIKKPLSLLQLINNGIVHFTLLKQEEKYSTSEE